MKNPNTSIRNFKLPSREELRKAIYSFTKKEWLVFLFLVLVLIIGTIGILQKINKSFMVATPMYGGSITEGVIGAPRFINPILATTEGDKDLVALIYSGLMRKNGDGSIIPDLAEKVDISKDGLTYTFTLKENTSFHDGEPVKVEDIIFTVNSIQDPIIKSPRRGNWNGVSVEKIDDRNIKFTLKQPFALFLENTTLGIMPSHVWENSPIELNEANMNPVGSGPYKVINVAKESSGIINIFSLEAFKKFALGKPFVKKITLKFYQNEEDLMNALKTNSVDQASSITPSNAQNLKDKHSIVSSVLPRIFGLFFNQNQNQLFTDKTILKAINLAIDKERIIDEIFKGYGVVINNPIPLNMVTFQELKPAGEDSQEIHVKEAQELLAKDGWKIGPSGYLEKTIVDTNKKKINKVLEFSISTGNALELTTTAEIIKQDLNMIGIKVEVKTFESGNLNKSVIRPRDYETLLFGQIVNSEADLYAFWHSSQRKDPGFNIAMYTNPKVDKLLEDASVVIDEESRNKKYIQFEEEIQKDMPVVFLYSPSFVYVTRNDLHGINIENIVSSSDRFAGAYLWYTKIDNIWKVFAK